MENTEEFINKIKELQVVASAAGKPSLVWEMFEELMLLAHCTWHNKDKTAERKKKWKVVIGSKKSR